MRPKNGLWTGLLALLSACEPEAHVTAPRHVAPPVDAVAAIPAGPVGGTLRGEPFVVREARFVVDRRVGHTKVDILLSAGRAEGECGPVKPASASAVWLRLEGQYGVEPQELRLEPGSAGPWSVHYQVRDGERWRGNADAAALVSIRAVAPDGKISGAIAVCFGDDSKSCVSGSFYARSCPPSIDAPVRGAFPVEAVPEQFAGKLRPKAP